MADEIWLCVVDEHGGRLLHGAVSEYDRLHIEVKDAILDTWEEHQHGRPAALGERPMPQGEYGGHTFASFTHEDDARRTRFAAEVARWLEDRASTYGIDRVSVFAPDRFLGSLRRAWPPRLAERIDEHHAELTNLDPGDLARHPAIAALVAEPHAR